MPFLLIGLLLVALIFLPQYWVRQVMRCHGQERWDFPGNGGELARHLLDEAGLRDVPVEVTEAGDHYDPELRAVRLTSANHRGRSITAIAVAAHEVSHAVQHARGERLFDWRGRLVRMLIAVDWLAMVMAFLIPIIAVAVRSPALVAVQIGLVIALLSLRVQRGGYIAGDDLPAARQVLKAAAFTYVAAALVSVVDILRLLRFGR